MCSPLGNKVLPCPVDATEAYRKGWEGYFAGLLIEANPYPCPRNQALATDLLDWAEGFSDAFDADADLQDVTPPAKESQ